MTVNIESGTPAPTAAATPTSTSTPVDWAVVPRVNLLPAEILQARRVSGIKRVLGVAVLATVAVCAGGVVWAQAGVGSAQDDLDAVQAHGAQLRAEQAKYAQVPTVLALIDSATNARQQAMNRDVLWYGLLSDLALTTPKGVKLDSLSVSLDQGTSTAPDPLTPAGIGQVSFTGKATRFPDVAAWLEAVATLHGLDGSTLQTATRGNPDGTSSTVTSGAPISFTSTIQVTSTALTHRYDRKAD
jgi:Tfp pilus assembly protein PilN